MSMPAVSGWQMGRTYTLLEGRRLRYFFLLMAPFSDGGRPGNEKGGSLPNEIIVPRRRAGGDVITDGTQYLVPSSQAGSPEHHWNNGFLRALRRSGSIGEQACLRQQ